MTKGRRSHCTASLDRDGAGELEDVTGLEDGGFHRHGLKEHESGTPSDCKHQSAPNKHGPSYWHDAEPSRWRVCRGSELITACEMVKINSPT